MFAKLKQSLSIFILCPLILQISIQNVGSLHISSHIPVLIVCCQVSTCDLKTVKSWLIMRFNWYSQFQRIGTFLKMEIKKITLRGYSIWIWNGTVVCKFPVFCNIPLFIIHYSRWSQEWIRIRKLCFGNWPSDMSLMFKFQSFRKNIWKMNLW